MNVLQFSDRRSREKEEPEKVMGNNQSPLDIAISNRYIQDISSVMISPSKGGFHLSMKTVIKNYSDHPLWLNDFGSKHDVAEKAIIAIQVALTNGIPYESDVLIGWHIEIEKFMESNSRILVLS